jgi:hypothetical protein
MCVNGTLVLHSKQQGSIWLECFTYHCLCSYIYYPPTLLQWSSSGSIPVEEEKVPDILLGKKINGDIDESRNGFGKRMRAPSHPSNLELLTAVSMNDQSFISYILFHWRLLVVFPQEEFADAFISNKFDSEEVKSLELMIGDRNDRSTDDSLNVSGKKMRPPSNPANLGLDTTVSIN